MLTIEDESSVLHDFEKAEEENPSPTKIIDDGRTIYGSRKLRLSKDDLWGRPVLCDFGEARIGSCHRGYIQPTKYRAPEVAFEMEWTSSADIWSVAALVGNFTLQYTACALTSIKIWDPFEHKNLFKATDKTGHDCPKRCIAEMVAYLGLPPLELIRKSKVAMRAFDEQGQSGATIVSKR